MTFKDAEAYILEVPKFTKKNELSNTRELLDRLGDLEKGKKIIHVAGSNGKGSVCAFLASILKKTGKKVGLFTSPHLEHLCERFQINGVKASEEEFTEAFGQVMQAVREMQQEGYPHPTFFELIFVIGMLIFDRNEVEYIVLETGLGGRFDATNVIVSPEICIITSVCLEHTEILGNSLSEIAFEKAGIIKKGIPVVYDAEQREIRNVIEETAKERQSKSYGVLSEMCQLYKITNKNIDFSFNTGYYRDTRFILGSSAFYQIKNAALALKTIEILDREKTIPMACIQAGIAEMNWPGRMQQIQEGVWIDGAHNVSGVEAFIKSVNCLEKSDNQILLFSAVQEKKYEEMIAVICNKMDFEEVIVTTVANKRAVAAAELERLFKKYTKKKVTAIPVIEEAVHQALQRRKEKGRLYCLGSLYLAGTIMECIRRKEND